MAVIWGHQDNAMQWIADSAVLCFFVVSGLLVSRSWFADPNLWRFFQRRFLRIWPGLALVVVVSAASAYYFSSGPWASMERLAAEFYLRNLLLSIFDWSFFPWRPVGMNGSLWTLPFEVDLYGALVLLGLFGRRFFFIGALATCAAAFLAIPINASQSSLGSAWSLYFAGFFFAGALLGAWPHWQRDWIVSLLVLIGASMFALGQANAGRLILIPILVVAIGGRSWPVLRSLSRYGDLSYGTYIWAWPVHQVVRLWLPSTLPVWIQLAAVIPLTLACAFMSWHVVEKTALRMKPRPRSDGKPSAPFRRMEVGSFNETAIKVRRFLSAASQRSGW